MKKPGKHGGRIVIRNLPFTLEKSKLQKTLEKIGQVQDLNLPWNTEKSRNQGYAFVEFSKKNISEKAIKTLNGSKIQGREISVDWALAKDRYEKAVKQEEISQDFKPQKVEPQVPEEPKPKSNKLYEGKTLFITNLNYQTDEDDLKEFFEQYGKLLYAKVVENKETGDSKGEAFVCFKNKEDCDKALGVAKENPSEMILQARQLNVMLAVSREKATELKSLKPPKEDKKNLKLAKETLILPDSEEFKGLSKADVEKRTKALKAMKEKLANPNVFVSPCRLMIRNLPKSVDEKKLRAWLRSALESQNPNLKNQKLFSQVRIARDTERLDSSGNKRSKGYAFVQCNKEEHAKTCVKELNNSEFFGKNKRPIVEYALEDHRMLRIRKLKKERREKFRQQLEEQKTEEEKTQEKPKKLSRGQRQRQKRREMKEQGLLNPETNQVTEEPKEPKEPQEQQKPTQVPKKRKRKDDFEIEVLEFNSQPRKRTLKKAKKREQQSSINKVIEEYRSKLLNEVHT